MMNAAESDFDRAVALRDQGEYAMALDILEPLFNQLSGSTFYLDVLADTYWELGQTSVAIEHFRRSTEIDPTSEISSLALFHCLLDNDDVDTAFDEMRRFLSHSSSDAYGQLLSDLKAELEE